MRYRSLIPNPAHVVGDMPKPIMVVPGQEFDSPVALHHPELLPIDDEAKAAAAERAELLAQQAREYEAQITGQAAVGELPDWRAALGLEPLPATEEA